MPGTRKVLDPRFSHSNCSPPPPQSITIPLFVTSFSRECIFIVGNADRFGIDLDSVSCICIYQQFQSLGGRMNC